MMKFLTRTLAASTALAFAASAAYATDNNRAFTDQDGTDNTMLIEQSGSNNAAGRAGDPTRFIQQDGAGNELDIVQSGSSNQIGASSKDRNNPQLGEGVDQTGDDNVMSITQSSNLGLIYRLQQIGNENSLDITQSGAQSNRRTSVIASIYQENTGNVGSDGNSITILQDRDTTSNPNPGGFDGNVHRIGNANIGGQQVIPADQGIIQVGTNNIIDVVQDGLRRNRIGFIEQRGSSNEADLDQIGQGNTINWIDQAAGSGETVTVLQQGDNNFTDRISQSGNTGNTATLSIFGNNNGSGFTGLAQGFAQSIAGGFESSIIQAGLNLSVNLTLDGDSNQYGINQAGTNNSLGAQPGNALTIDGDFNELGVNQTGNDNAINIGNGIAGVIEGDRNDIGLSQAGANNTMNIDFPDPSNDNSVRVNQLSGEFATTGNTADITLGGDDNTVDVAQAGQNTATVGISGTQNRVLANQIGLNDASVMVDGINNHLGVGQVGSNQFGSDGAAMPDGGVVVTIEGNNNGNNASLTAEFTGDALTASLDPISNGQNLLPGMILQGTELGHEGNLIKFDIVGNDNLFAFVQAGSDNSIVGTQNGDSNQVAIAQVGNMNSATFNQVGTFNNLGLSQ